MKRRILRAALVAVALALPGAASANLILNSGFEDAPNPTSPYQYRTGNEITDWFITSTAVHFDNTYQPVGVPNYSVQLETGVGGGTPASIEQTVTTVPGATYYVSFLLASYQGLTADLLVTVDGASNPYQVSATAYTLQTFSFVADDLSATLKFANTGAHGFSFPQIDNVSMVPEPTTMIAGALLLLPFAASAVRKLRKA